MREILRPTALLFSAIIVVLSGCAHFGAVSAPEDELFVKAERALGQHRFNEAHYYYEEVVRKFPKAECADDALYKMAYIEVYLGKYADAQRNFSALLEKYPNSHWRFDASVWDGVLGELAACREVGGKRQKDDRGKNSRDDIEEKLKKLEAENSELKRQIQKLRELLTE